MKSDITITKPEIIFVIIFFMGLFGLGISGPDPVLQEPASALTTMPKPEPGPHPISLPEPEPLTPEFKGILAGDTIEPFVIHKDGYSILYKEDK